MLDGIQTAQNKLEDIVREDALASKFINQEMAESRKDYKDVSEYEEACRKFEVHMKPIVESLEKRRAHWCACTAQGQEIELHGFP